jgi:sulfur carrier protein
VTLNGQPRDVEETDSVTSFLVALKVNPQHVAVAINGEVVPRSTWADVRVNAGDAVEIVRAVGGG